MNKGFCLERCKILTVGYRNILATGIAKSTESIGYMAIRLINCRTMRCCLVWAQDK
nr:MAG TPA: hypothetical protein [Caudoviricetes sp.]